MVAVVIKMNHRSPDFCLQRQRAVFIVLWVVNGVVFEEKTNSAQ